MPTVRLTVGDVAVELTANESSTAELSAQALALYRDAVAAPRPPQASIGFAHGLPEFPNARKDRADA